MKSLVINGTMSFDATKMKEHIVHFNCILNNIFGDQNWVAPFMSIDVDERNWLERHFE